MDWKLSKSIFIAAFLLINLILIYILYNESNAEVERLAETTDVLDETNIDTSALDDAVNAEMQILVGQPAKIKNEEKISEDKEKRLITIPVSEGVTFAPEGLTTFKNSSVYKGNEYYYDEVMSEKDSIIFNQHYENYPIFSNEAARLFFSEESQTVTQGYIENIEVNEYSSPTTVRPPKVIVEELYLNEEITENAVIEGAELGYYIILEEENQVMMRPKWQFEVTDGDLERVLYVDALSQTEDIIERE